MRYVVLLIVFALIFSGVVYATQSKEQTCGISSTSLTKVAVADTSKKSPGIPPGVPAPAQPKLEKNEKIEEVEKLQNQVVLMHGSCNTWVYKRPVCDQPIRNVGKFFHNRRPVRRFIGWIFCGR